MCASRANLYHPPKRPTLQADPRSAALGRGDLNLAPGDTASPPRSQRLHCSFLRRKPRSITAHPCGPRSLALAIRDFSIGVDPLSETVASDRDDLLDPRDLN